MAYQLEFKNTSGLYNSCKICDKQQCRGCLIPYTEDETLADKLALYGLQRNDTLFEAGGVRGREVVCQVTWHKSITGGLFDFLATAQPGA